MRRPRPKLPTYGRATAVNSGDTESRTVCAFALMPSLTKRQQQELIEIITEKFGGDLQYAVFADRMMLLFEDVGGDKPPG